MAEWSKAHDWKSCVPLKGTVSSNLTLSANKKGHRKVFFFIGDEVRTLRNSEFDYKRKAGFEHAGRLEEPMSAVDRALRMGVVWGLYDAGTDCTLENTDGQTAYDIAEANPGFKDDEFLLVLLSDAIDAQIRKNEQIPANSNKKNCLQQPITLFFFFWDLFCYLLYFN